ncbi:3D domain-containing protein [Peribacillus frigoritolerans]|nr:3D domain-containing protein [Peribacillus frigoritolerans]
MATQRQPIQAGAIKGNRVDIFVPNEQDAVNWGVKKR